MTREEAIEQLRRLAELAKKVRTPGPLECVPDEESIWLDGGSIRIQTVDDSGLNSSYVAWLFNDVPNDAAFFAAAGSIDWPALLAAVEGARSEH